MRQSRQLNIRLSEELHARLVEEKKRTGAPVSEIIRRAVDAYLRRDDKDSR